MKNHFRHEKHFAKINYAINCYKQFHKSWLWNKTDYANRLYGKKIRKKHIQFFVILSFVYAKLIFAIDFSCHKFLIRLVLIPHIYIYIYVYIFIYSCSWRYLGPTMRTWQISDLFVVLVYVSPLTSHSSATHIVMHI